MTSPTVFVLFLAQVCQFIGVVSNQISDTSNKHKSMRILNDAVQSIIKEDVYNENLRMKTRTNVFNVNYNRVNDVHSLKYEINSYGAKNIDVDNVKIYDKFFTKNEKILDRHLNINSNNVIKLKNRISSVKYFKKKKRVRRDEKAHKCDSFSFKKGKAYISHPHVGDSDNVNYSGNTICTTVIRGSEGYVVQLTFVDMFHIEDHPECNYDYLEVRDGDKGYYNLLGKVCGEKFPPQITTSGPNVWLKFYSDDTIEYKGFRVQIDFIPKDTSVSVPESCVTELSGKYGRFDSDSLNEDCKDRTVTRALDYLWSIDVPEGYKIYLNFTTYTVGEPNECDKNFVQVFGSVLEYEEKLAHYCGSVAMPVSTTGPSANPGEANEDDDLGNIMHVRLYAAREQKAKTFIDATFTAYRTLDLSKNNSCDSETEFDCQDNTCIDIALRCNNYANCRLKADEEKDLCMHTTESLIQQPRIQMIVSIFCVILSGITFVFLFKCIKKLYYDHTTIKEHIHQSCEDRLDSMIGSQLVLDSKKMLRDSEPRASLERDNHTNEMFKQQRKLQQKVWPTSIDSDSVQETDRIFEEEIWRRKENEVPKTENVKIERSGRTRRKKEQELKIENNERTRRVEQKLEDINIELSERIEEQVNLPQKSEFSKKSRKKESENQKENSELRDISVSVPDTKQSGCQTRDSLFQTNPIMKSDGSSTANGRGLSKFGQSGASIAKPSPPQIKPSEIVIEVIRPIIITEQEKKPQKKVPDRRPMSAETTRSAPDVIVLAKPTP